MIPIKKGITGTDIPNIAVETSDSTIPRKPILVEGGGSEPVLETLNVTENGTYTPEAGVDGFDEVNVEVSDIPAVIEPLSVTENGTYTAPEGVDGYSPVNVNVQTVPDEVLESEYDLLHCNSTDGFRDTYQGITLSSRRYDDFSDGYLTANGGSVNLKMFDYGYIKKCIIQMGAFDRTLEPSQRYLGLFNLVYDVNSICLYYDNDEHRWLISESGTYEYISDTIIPKYAVDGATIELVYGARYINGELYRGKKSGNIITEDYTGTFNIYIHATNNVTYAVETDTSKQAQAGYPDYMATLRIGTRGSNWLGALFENAKIYGVNNMYNKYYEEV